MKKWLETAWVWVCTVAVLLAIVGVVGGLIWAQVWVWQLQHPGAPLWTILLHK